MLDINKSIVMPALSTEELQNMLARMREALRAQARMGYIYLIVSIFEGLYVYQQTGINILKYDGICLDHISEESTASELLSLAHEHARILSTIPESKAPDADFHMAIGFTPLLNNKWMVVPHVAHPDAARSMKTILEQHGAKNTSDNLDFVQEERIEFLVDYQTDVADIVLPMEIIRKMCCSNEMLALRTAASQVVQHAFSEYIEQEQANNNMCSVTANAIWAAAMKYAENKANEEKEIVEILYDEFLRKLDIVNFCS